MWVVIMLSILATYGAAETFDGFYKVNLGGRKPGSATIDTTRSRSRVDCARKCSAHGDCRSIFYTPGEKECQQHSVLYTNATVGIVSIGQTAVYYEKFVEVTTTTSTTITTTAPAPATTTPCTVPPTFACPVDNVGVKEMWLPDCSLVKVWVIVDYVRNFTLAKKACETEGGQMYQIITPAKMNLTLDLMRCPGVRHSKALNHRDTNAKVANMYRLSSHCLGFAKTAYASAVGFWIDGVYNTSTSVWETTGGTPLPMTQGDFWYPARPNKPGIDNCVHMRIDPFNFFWDDAGCDEHIDMAICDMP